MSDSEDEQQDSRVVENEQLISSKPRVESGYPTGYDEKGSERVKTLGGGIKTRGGEKVCIPTKCAIEFIATMFLFFFGTLGAVNSSTVAVDVATTLVGSSLSGNSSDPQYTTTGSGHSVISNPLGTFLAALSWGGVIFMCLRSFPGVAVNPFATIATWFFQQKSNKTSLDIVHYVHTLEETVLVVLSQVIGGIVALLFVYVVQGRDTSLLGETLPSALVTRDIHIFCYEGAASFLFYSLILLYSSPRRSVTALEQSAFISLSLFFVVMGFGGFTGSAVNPVHTLAPAIVRSIFLQVPLRFNVIFYLLGQAAGFFVAGALNYFIIKTSLLTRILGATTQTKSD